jgi:hypothetical protein
MIYSKVIMHYAMKTCAGGDLGTRWKIMVSFAAAVHPVKEPPDVHWIRGWVALRACLDAVEKKQISYPCQESNPSHTAHRCTD